MGQPAGDEPHGRGARGRRHVLEGQDLATPRHVAQFRRSLSANAKTARRRSLSDRAESQAVAAPAIAALAASEARAKTGVVSADAAAATAP